jgi:hypothetical protein
VKEKLTYLENRISNLSESKKKEILIIINNNLDANCSKLLSIVRRGWPASGINLKNYWINRGWSESEAEVKSKEYRLKNRIKRKSPFSREFYMNKINPLTNKTYTISEADNIRNSYRPIRKEFWMKMGYSEEESERKATECKYNNNKTGADVSKNKPVEFHRNKSPRCKEYYINKGYSQEEANLLVSTSQVQFSLQKCIEKFGEIEGYKIWKERQERWIETLNNKSQEEIDEINRKKRSRSSINTNLTLYLIELKYLHIDKIYYKIGVTTKSVYKRYSFLRGFIEYKLIYEQVFRENLASLIETNIINKLSKFIQQDHTLHGYTECFDPNLITKEILLEHIKNASETYRHS